MSNNPAQHAARLREWRHRNPLRAAAHDTASTANQRAKKLGVAGWLRGSDVLALWQRQPVCVACGQGRGIDHIVAFVDGGLNVPENLQTMCLPCNSAKDYAARKDRPRRAFCDRGHPLSDDNLWRHPTNGRTACRACDAWNHRQRRLRRHDATA